MYEEQQKVLEWPEVMPKQFKSWINSNGPDAEIPPGWIGLYQTEVIKSEFPKLAKIVDAAPEGEDSRNVAPGGGPQHQHKVVWEDQESLRRKLEMSDNRATSFEVRLRQEDLWVVQALLNIIAITNQDSLYSSRVKCIEELAIGADTASKFEDGMKPGHIERLTPSMDAEGGGMPEPAMPGEGLAPPPDEGRYVDADGKPQPAGTWQQHQFKRMPVHLRLVMDQREITRLLAACANYPLPVEVRQLRINPGAGSRKRLEEKCCTAAGGRSGRGSHVGRRV